MLTMPLRLGVVLLFLPPAHHPLPTVQSPPLTRTEARTRDWIAAHREEQIGVLERLVNQQSGTLNVPRVRAAVAIFRAELDSLGFTTTWVDMPAEMRRGGHLVAERPARSPSTFSVPLC